MSTFGAYTKIPQINTGNTFLTIPVNGTTAPIPFDCMAVAPLGFVTPSDWVASTLTFFALPYLLGGIDYSSTGNIPANNQLAPIYDETDTGTPYQLVTRAGYGYYRLSPPLFNSVRYINITSSVNQTVTPKNVYLILPPIFQSL